MYIKKMQKLFLRAIKNNVAVFVLFSFWAALIYSNTLNAPFHYDDYNRIVENPDIQWEEISFERLKGLIFASRPVATLTFALNYYFGGADVNGYHYVNLEIHIITAFIFFLFLKTIFALPHLGQKIRDKNCEIAFIASLLWLSSPVQIQAVTYIIQRMAALAAMFYVSAMYFYMKGRLSFGKNRYLFYLLTLLTTILALGSKENTIPLPFYLLLLEIMIIRGGNIRFLFLKKWVFIGVAIPIIAYISTLSYYYYINLEVNFDSWFIYLLKTRFFTGIRAIAFYITQLFLPVPSRLSLEHDFQISRSLLDPPSILLILSFLLGVVSYIAVSFKKRPLFSFFTLWFLGNLALENFYPYIITVFEHRLYLPSMGFFAVVGIGMHNLIISVKEQRRKRLSIIALFIIVIAIFSINTYIRNNVWKDPYTLWLDVIKKSPNIPIGYTQLGVTFFKDENYSDALNCYLKARSIAPRDPSVRYGLGVIYFSLKEYEEAIREFNYVASLGHVKPNKSSPSIGYYFARIAKNYYGHGRAEEAIRVLDNALLYEPDEPMLKELKGKMTKGTITPKEIMAK